MYRPKSQTHIYHHYNPYTMFYICVVNDNDPNSLNFIMYFFIELCVVYTRTRVQLGCYSRVLKSRITHFDSGRHYKLFRQSSGSSDGWGPE